jgi:hypothetical protein
MELNMKVFSAKQIESLRDRNPRIAKNTKYNWDIDVGQGFFVPNDMNTEKSMRTYVYMRNKKNPEGPRFRCSVLTVDGKRGLMVIRES